MGKNVKTYLLLGVVMIIWGIIGFRILSALSPEPEQAIASSEISYRPVTTVQRDTFSIKADYRDPFLGTYSTSKKNTPKKTVKREMPPIDLQYTGSMVNSSTNMRIYFVTINGQQHLLEKGKSAGEVKLLSGSQQAITIRYQGFTKKVQLQQ